MKAIVDEFTPTSTPEKYDDIYARFKTQVNTEIQGITFFRKKATQKFLDACKEETDTPISQMSPLNKFDS